MSGGTVAPVVLKMALKKGKQKALLVGGSRYILF